MFSQLLGTRSRSSDTDPPEPPITTQTSSLLNLPLEIRQLIFSSVFEPFDAITITPAWPPIEAEGDDKSTSWPADQESFAISRYNLHSQLLSTCRQVHGECLPLLYSRRVFNLTARESLKLFLHNIQPRTFQFVHHIILDWDSLQDFAWSLPKFEYATALSGLHVIETATWRNRHIDTTSTRWRNVRGYERSMCQAAADILNRHAKLCILAEEQFVRKGSVTQTSMIAYQLGPNDQVVQTTVELGPKRVKWRFLSSESELKDCETVVDVRKDLYQLKATQDEATDGGFHLPMIDPF